MAAAAAVPPTNVSKKVAPAPAPAPAPIASAVAVASVIPPPEKVWLRVLRKTLDTSTDHHLPRVLIELIASFIAPVDCVFDPNDLFTGGVFEYLGTRYDGPGGAAQWFNPAGRRARGGSNTQQITLSAKAHFSAGRLDGVTGLYSQNRGLVFGSNCTEPVASGNWFAVDLEAGRSLRPTAYSLSNDGTAGRGFNVWDLHGSSDGSVWYVLDRRFGGLPRTPSGHTEHARGGFELNRIPQRGLSSAADAAMLEASNRWRYSFDYKSIQNPTRLDRLLIRFDESSKNQYNQLPAECCAPLSAESIAMFPEFRFRHFRIYQWCNVVGRNGGSTSTTINCNGFELHGVFFDDN